jgi:hypothetical protein
VTIRQVMARYDRLRAKYFMDAEPPYVVPPPATELRWYWLSEKGPNWAVTHFDQDGDADSIGLDPGLRSCSRWLLSTLLHELTHIRNPKLNCGSKSNPPDAWLREQRRLSALGAPLL